MEPIEKAEDFSLSGCQGQDATGLIKWAGTRPSYETKNAFTLAVALRRYDYWEDEDENNVLQSCTYWGIKDGEWGWQITSVKEYFRSEAYTSAMLHSSLTDSNIFYPSWSYIPDRGWGLAYNGNDFRKGWHNNQTFIYIKKEDDGLSSNNWCIRYVQAVGVQAIVDKDKNITQEDLNGDILYIDGKKTYGLCTAVKVTLFYPGDEKGIGVFSTRTYYHNRTSTSDNLKLADGWTTKDESDTYSDAKNELNSKYTLFRGAEYDYEAHHINGIDK